MTKKLLRELDEINKQIGKLGLGIMTSMDAQIILQSEGYKNLSARKAIVEDQLRGIHEND